MVDKERERFYLLPGQGGRAYHRKQRTFLLWSVIVALAFSTVFAIVLYFVDRKPF